MRIYLMPIAIIPIPIAASARQPKYVADFGVATWGMMDYGDEPICLCAVEADAALHATLTAHADVTALPADITQAIGAGPLTAVTNALDALNIPSNWILSTHTYRQVLRVVCLVFQFHQRLQGLGFGRIFTAGVTLSTQFNQLAVGVRNNMIAAAQSLNFDTSGLTGASTLRAILKSLADQFNIPQVFFGANVL
jgi:hypothetical protein